MELMLQAFPIFLLIFCRITSFFVVAPVFSTRNVPASFKIGLGFFIAILVYLVYGVQETVALDASYVLMVIREVLTGLLLGFVAYLFVTVVQIAGGYIDMQMGFGMANVMDPVSGFTVPLLGNFKFIVVMLLFLSMNGHHYLLMAIMKSYDWLPLDNNLFSQIQQGHVSEFLVVTFSQVSLLALQLSAPLVVALFLTDVGLGFLARTAPQFNVFVIGIPLKILVGLFMLALLMPSFSSLIGHLFGYMFTALENLLAGLQQQLTP